MDAGRSAGRRRPSGSRPGGRGGWSPGAGLPSAHGLAPVGTEVARRRGAGSRRGAGGGSPVRRATRPRPQARLARKPSASARTTSGAAVFSQPGTPGFCSRWRTGGRDEAAREMPLRRHSRGRGSPRRSACRSGGPGSGGRAGAGSSPSSRRRRDRLGRPVDAVARGRQPVDHSPPPCQAVALSQAGSLAACGGIDPHRGADLALGPPVARCGASRAPGRFRGRWSRGRRRTRP